MEGSDWFSVAFKRGRKLEGEGKVGGMAYRKGKDSIEHTALVN